MYLFYELSLYVAKVVKGRLTTIDTRLWIIEIDLSRSSQSSSPLPCRISFVARFRPRLCSDSLVHFSSASRFMRNSSQNLENDRPDGPNPSPSEVIKSVSRLRSLLCYIDSTCQLNSVLSVLTILDKDMMLYGLVSEERSLRTHDADRHRLLHSLQQRYTKKLDFL